MRAPWLLVSGDFVPWGGMDRANFALASRLAATGDEVHLVTHRASESLSRRGAIVHPVRRPGGAHILGTPLLARAGRACARELGGRRVRVVGNGGNCIWPGIAWVHYVHAAYDPRAGASAVPRAIASVQRRYVLDRERRAVDQARIVVCNSRRTQRDVVDRLGVPVEKTRVIYYGTDASEFAPVRVGDRQTARRAFGIPDDRPIAVFVGALGDRRKGFDVLFEAWARLCRTPGWDADLLVAGEGRELPAWHARSESARLGGRVRFLGYRRDVSQLLAAADLLVHPVRYEAYGLAVHEAICRGVPALVSADAGVAERYPATLAPLLLRDLSPDALQGALL